MGITFNCTKCGQSIVINQQSAGLEIFCPHCQASLKIPQIGSTVSTPKPAGPETKPCPFCAETIKYEAIVCRFCGRDLVAKPLLHLRPAAPMSPPSASQQPAFGSDFSGSQTATASQTPHKSRMAVFITSLGFVIVVGVVVAVLYNRNHQQSPPVTHPPQPQISKTKPLPSQSASQIPITVPSNYAAIVFREAIEFAKDNQSLPDKWKEIKAKYQSVVDRFPYASETTQARQQIAFWNDKQHEVDLRQKEVDDKHIAEEQHNKLAEQQVREAPCEDEPARQQQEEQREKEQKAQVAAEQAFSEFSKSFLAAWGQRDYAAAMKLAQQAMVSPVFIPLKEYISGCEDAAKRLNKFWESFPNDVMKLKGKSLTLQGTSSELADVKNGNLMLEKKVEGSTARKEVPIAKLTTEEILKLAAACHPANDAETLLNMVWFSYAEDQSDMTKGYLDAAQKAGANTEATGKVMTTLSQASMERNAEKTLVQLRTLIKNKRFAEARASFELLESRYFKTKIVESANEELASVGRKLDEVEATLARTKAIESNEAFLLKGKTPVEGNLLLTLEGHKQRITSLAFSPDARYVVSSSEDQTVRVWNLVKGWEEEKLVAREGNTVHDAAFTADGKYVVAGGNSLKLWEVGTWRLICKSSKAWRLAVSPDGSHILVSNNNGVTLIETETGKTVQSFSVYKSTPFISTQMAFNPSGLHVMIPVNDYVEKRWEMKQFEVATAQLINTFRAKSDIMSVAYNPDGCYLVTGHGDGTISIWDVKTGQVVRSFEGHPHAQVYCTIFSPDGRYVLSAGADKMLKLWDVATGKLLRIFEGHAGFVTAAAFSPTGRIAVSGGSNGKIMLWNLAVR